MNAENTTPEATNHELQQSVQEAAEKIKKFSEDLRAKIHTAQIGAEDKALGLLQTVETISEKLHIKTDAETKAFELLESVDALSEKLQGYAENFEHKLTESHLQFHLGLMEAMGKWEEVKHQATSVFDAGAGQLDSVSHNVFDEVKLKAHLGKMEAEEFINKGREDLAKAWQQVSHQSTMAVRNMNQSIGDIIHRFI